MEHVFKVKSPNPNESVYVVGPMYLEDGMTTAVVVTLPKNAGKINIVTFKEEERCTKKQCI